MNRTSAAAIAILLALTVGAYSAPAPAAKPWQRVHGCKWKADKWNDGDSFHRVRGDQAGEIVGRLQFADTP
ncbi:MAG: hypothetical protein M3463_03490 [Verrucomicrobiota bacterium]|nr:hypothetical protein [Verrucomicrobiota bacterium]